jgi:lipid II:glycine glycyltransferase (peptidoglycan interpeptide bridge formation enzyme)
MELLFTKNSDWLKKWDDFVLNEDKASHLLLSEWNKSFQKYGFDYEICIALNNEKIIGGYAAVIAKALFFKFYIIPFGPIISETNLSDFNELIAQVPIRAKFLNCCYAHITLPVSEIVSKHNYRNLPELSILNSATEGHLFKYVYSSNGLNWKSFDSIKDEDELLESLKVNLRRDIRSSIRKGLVIKELSSESELKMGYDLCLENAKQNNYSLREWKSFKETLLHLIEKKQAKFIAAFKDDDLKGSMFLVKSGNYYTYIFGGTKKEKPDLLVGHFLQFEAMKIGIIENLSGYNISLGGSKGVVNLKNSYADFQILFEHSKFHWKLKPFYLRLFLFLDKRLKSNKKLISKIVSIIRRK